MSSDWHRAYIVAALHAQGVSLSELGRRHGLSRHTVKNALCKHYPHGEKIIADFLGLEPSQIWPSRYNAQTRRKIHGNN